MRVGQSCSFRKRAYKLGPSSTVITIPRGLEVEPGDEIEVTVTLISRVKHKGDAKS